MLEQLLPGLFRWTAPHPDWRPEDDSLDTTYRSVASHVFAAPDALVLVDALVPPTGSPDAGRLWEALDPLVAEYDLPVIAVLTIHWHERSLQEVCERHNAGAWVPVGAAGQVAYRPINEFVAGTVLGGGVHTFATARPGEVVLWLPEPRAMLFGDVVIGTQDGSLRLCPEEWVGGRDALDAMRAELEPLVGLRTELVLPAHGTPVLSRGHDALASLLGVPLG